MASILVIDDSEFQRNILQGIIEGQGHEILNALNGREGIEMAVSRSPDCILLDLIMPEIGGLEVLGLLRDKGLDIPTIVVTADIQESTRKKCMELGAVAFLNKPVKEDALNETIKRILDSREEATK